MSIIGRMISSMMPTGTKMIGTQFGVAINVPNCLNMTWKAPLTKKIRYQVKMDGLIVRLD